MTRARAIAMLAGLGFALAGCEFSEIEPDAEVTISGTVVGSDGAAVAAQPVVLLTEPTVSDVAFGLPFGLGSLGFACLVEDPPPPCDTRRRGTTDETGRFTFDITGRETQGTFGEAARMTLSAAAPPREHEWRGPTTTGAFVVRSVRPELEPLPLVRAQPSLSVVDGRVHVDWGWEAGTAMRGSPGSPELVYEIAGAPIWVAPADAAGTDVRVLEDTRGALSIGEHRRADGTIDDLTYRSETIGYRSDAGVPMSRGAPCREPGGVAVTPCSLTDGDLTTTRETCVEPDNCPLDALLDLGRVTELDLVVVRGCRDECAIHVSEDGEAWLPIGLATGPFALFENAGSARFLQVGSALDHHVAEVSVWDGPAAAGRVEQIAPDRTDGSSPSGAPAPGDDGPPLWLLVLAGVLVVAVAVGTGVAIGRGRRPTV